MRRYQQWLSVGLLALTPGIAMAGPLDAPSSSSQGQAPKRAKASPNQELAEKVAGAMRKGKFTGYDIELDVSKGVVTLSGVVGNTKQRDAAAKIARSVPGVVGVNNRLRVSDQEAPVQQAAAPKRQMIQQTGGTMPAAGRAKAIRQAAYEDAEQVQNLPPGLAPTPGPAPTQNAPQAMPAYGPPAGAASHVAYNQPNFPDNAWPTYAQYPNYSAVTYPSQYAASAWPYIGPFYPYPQVPLGWRKATLEWDDGYWNLNFRSRTDRWWWFCDPKNW
jgi:BON domain